MSRPAADAMLAGNIPHRVEGVAVMSTSLRQSAGVVAVAAAAALVVWAAVRLLGVDLAIETGTVGPVDVVVAVLVAGVAAWAVHRVLSRRAGSARWWPFVGSTALAVSIIGPSYLADGAAGVALIGMHLVVGVILILGFARFVPRPA
jgi:Family of unknown function (DUF6069)